MLLISTILLLIGRSRGTFHKGLNLGTFSGHLPQAVKVIKITNTVAVPVPYPVPYPKHVPVPVSVPKPVPYAVPQPVPVEVTKPVVIQQAVPVEVPRPYPIPQPYTVKVPQPINIPIPSEYLVAPQVQANVDGDYAAILNAGNGNVGYAGSAAFAQAQSYSAQQTYGNADQTGYYAEPVPGLLESYSASAQVPYMLPNDLPAAYSQPATDSVSLDQSFETNNSLEDQATSGSVMSY